MDVRKEYHVAVAFKYIVATVVIKITMKVITVPCHQVNMDVRKESHVAAALKYIEENLPVGEEGLYGLVNNAGVSFLGDGEGDDPSHFVRCVFAESLTGRPGVRYQTLSDIGPPSKFSTNQWSFQVEKQVDVNLVGTMRVTKLCLPLLKVRLQMIKL